MTSKLRKRLFVVLIIVLILLILLFTANVIVTALAKKEIWKLTEKELIPGFSIQFGDVSTNLLTKTVTISDIVFSGDTNDPGRLSFARIGTIKVSGVKVKKLLKDNELHLKEIDIINPEVVLHLIRE